MKAPPLIDATTLADHFLEPGWVVLDVRCDLMDPASGRRAYEAGHIPGAAFADVDHDLSGAKTGTNGRHPLPERAALVERFRDWGIGPATQIVAYDAHGGQFAARLWWLARWLGHDQVAVLDGGWPAWLAAKGGASQEAPDRLRGDFAASAPLEAVVTADEVLATLGDRRHLIIDARAAERFEGKVEPIDPVAGHIPGAANRFWSLNLTESGRFKPADQLREEFTALLDGHALADVIHQCGSGVSACHNQLALAVAGLTGTRLYAGSWSEWAADPARPVATGPR
ncbi:MAG: sulfurtransferase [Burkholderiaceae bacterium]